MPAPSVTPSRPLRGVPVPARAAILAWFDERGRSFPFRGVRDPYAILVSEAMAQQTQIKRATEAWSSFIARFPTVQALAAASPADVLRQWRGLGYNRRALNLQRAARTIVEVHGGAVPDDIAALERLPGVGPYTARAVAALAFGHPVGAVDTNVRRVLSRLVVGGGPVTAAELQAVADASVARARPADWTHALMDLGSTVCRPARPDCATCPARPWCPSVAPDGRQTRRRAPGRPSTPSPPAFPATSRWLRGRLLDRLRDASDIDWVGVDASIGGHDRDAVERALAGLARDGLVERHPTEPLLARLPLR